MKKYLIIFIAAAIFYSLARADVKPGALTGTAQAVVYGKVMILGGSEAIEGASIDIDGDTTAGVSTSHDGTYTLTLAPGKAGLVFSAYGFETRKKTVEAASGEKKKLDVYLDRVDFVSDAVVVSAKKDKNDVVTDTIDRAEIKKVPGTGGDALRAVQSMPGVAAISDYSSGLAVQGGGPSDNLYLLDNIPWPIPFHFGGILSTVYSDLLSSVDLNTAGFGAQWGDTMGAVLDAKTRAGDKDALHGSADVSIITAQALLEGPIGLGDASIAIYGRRSYLDLIVGKFMQSKGLTVFPFFWDIGGSLDFTLGKDNHIKGIALASDDALELNRDAAGDTGTVFTGNFSMDNSAVTSGISWTNTSIYGFTSDLTFYYYNIKDDDSIGTGFTEDLGQANYGLKEEIDWAAGSFLGVDHDIRAGADMEKVHDSADVELAFDFVHQTSEPASVFVDGWHMIRGGYLQDTLKLLPDVDFTAGIRYDKDDMVVRDTTLPRFCLSWQSDPVTLWKAAWGIYSQYPTDVQLNSEFGNPLLTPNIAEHTALSVERKLSKEISLRLDGYYKYYTNLVVEDSTAGVYSNSGAGTAKGVELFLNADYGEKFFGWISYAYSRSERIDPQDGHWVLYQYDQPNILSAVGSYSITPAWSIGAKLHYNTGPLYQKLLGTYTDVNGIEHGIYSNDYSQRLGDYLRLDVRTDYSFRYEGWKLTVYVEILNVLNRLNPYTIMYSNDFTTSQIVDNLPFLPYLGVEAQF
jgi:hypothetical protein